MHIQELQLFTNQLEQQKTFYKNVLELEEVESSNKNEIAFKIGNSILRFIEKNDATPYHFAINIFSNQEEEALVWLKDRVTILKDGNNEIQDFEFWNAKALYFYDEDKNIVEFIARKNLNINSDNSFSSKSLLGISEIGLPSTDIKKTYNSLNDKMNIPIYSGDFDDFCAIGDENGLFICVDPNKRKWFPVNDEIYDSEFESTIAEQNQNFVINYTRGNFIVTS